MRDTININRLVPCTAYTQTISSKDIKQVTEASCHHFNEPRNSSSERVVRKRGFKFLWMDSRTRSTWYDAENWPYVIPQLQSTAEFSFSLKGIFRWNLPFPGQRLESSEFEKAWTDDDEVSTQGRPLDEEKH